MAATASELRRLLEGLAAKGQAVPHQDRPAVWAEFLRRVFGERPVTPLEVKAFLTEGRPYVWSLLSARGIDRSQPVAPKLPADRALQLLLMAYQEAFRAGPGAVPWGKVPRDRILDRVQLYPEPDDPRFHETLYWKKEFHHKRSDLRGKRPEDLCRADRPFELFPYQKLLRNLFSPSTPYRGLMLFHMPGSGKTCSAITIAEQFRHLMAANPSPAQKRALVIVPSNPILQNFVNQIHDPVKARRERQLGLPPGSMQCTGDLYPEAPPGFHEDFYDLRTRQAFRNEFLEMRKEVLRHLPSGDQELRDEKLRQEIRSRYSNRVIIVDEVHHLKLKTGLGAPEDGPGPAGADEDPGFNPYSALVELLQAAENVRLVVMTATPVFDAVTGVVDIFNLLLLNDGLPPLELQQVFHRTGPGPLGWEFRAEGREALARVSRRYVSYVRENPVTFPRVLELTHASVRARLPDLRAYVPAPTLDLRGQPIPRGQRLTRDLVLVRCPMSPYQYEHIEDAVALPGERDHVMGFMASSLIVFPQGGTSKEGFAQCFRQLREKGPAGEAQYEYQPAHRGFLRNVARHSSKYAALSRALPRGEGIHFVYGAYNEIGIYTLAMLLEEQGYENVFGTPYLFGARVPPEQRQCALCPKRAGEHRAERQEGHAFVQAKFAVFDRETPSAAGANYQRQILDLVRRDDNLRGQALKVVLGSRVASEGVDFANVRHVHILVPWWNLSLITQVIGRAVRSCSHVRLPEKDRTVTVYRYCASAPDGEAASRETPDESVWRYALIKDRGSKDVERVLKENSIDCALNKPLNTQGDVQDGSRECEYGPCEYRCHYEATAAEERSRVPNADTAARVIEQDQVRQAMFHIARMYREGDVYTLDDLVEGVRRADPDIELRWVYMALDQLVSHMSGAGPGAPDSRGALVDAEGREGYLQYVRQHYVFLPEQYSANPRVPLELRRAHVRAGAASVPLPVPAEYAEPAASGQRGAPAKVAWSPAWWRGQLREPPEVLHRALDALSDADAQRALEACIEAGELPDAVLSYFRQAVLLRRAGAPPALGWGPGSRRQDVYGHTLGSVPRCWDAETRAWGACPPLLSQLAEHRRRVYRGEVLEPFVGYLEEGDERGLGFKVLDQSVTKKKAVTEGKRCNTFPQERLLAMFRAYELPGPAHLEKIQQQCARLELALRRTQIGWDVSGLDRRCFYHRRAWAVLKALPPKEREGILAREKKSR